MEYHFLGKRISGRFATVSGVLTTRTNIIGRVARTIPEIGVLMTKSIGVEPNSGNREPIICEMQPGCFANAVGLRNPGMVQFHRDLESLIAREPDIFRERSLGVSVYGKDESELVRLTAHFSDIADFIEANFSCPHAKPGYGASIGCYPELTYRFTKAMVEATDKPIIVKLTPNAADIGLVAKAAVEAGAAGISAINTLSPECYIEPHSGKPILYNPAGHIGGKHGRWIKEAGLGCVRRVRAAVGPEVPIIGMGGVRDASDVAQYEAAGADIIGVGSAIAMMDDERMARYFHALEKGLDVSGYLEEGRIMEYVPYRIKRLRYVSADMRAFTFDKPIAAEPSQFVFMFIPSIGEKPFAVSDDDPLSLVIRRIDPLKVKPNYHPQTDLDIGKFTNEGVWNLRCGDEALIRGPYGKGVQMDGERIFIVAGGTGIAVGALLAKRARRKGIEPITLYGVRNRKEAVYVSRLREYGTLIIVPDDGRQGRMLDMLEDLLKAQRLHGSSVYNIGPDAMMRRAMKIEVRLFPAHKIFASLETNTMCGIGLCGECESDGYRTCVHGTFLGYEHIFPKI